MNRLEDRWPEILILTATSSLFWVKDLLSFLSVEEFAGRDLVGNYAFTWLMQQNIFHGEIFSWTNQWLLGFPSFEMYPPFFFFFTSFLDILTFQFFGLQFWFKAIVFLSVFLLPVLTYVMMNRVFGQTEAFFAGFYTLFFIFVYPPVSQAYQVFSVGLVAQGFAFLMVLGSIGLMLRDMRKNKIISGVLLGLAALSHPFVALVGFILSASLVITKKEIENIIPALIGGCIAAPWILNAITQMAYTTSYTFQPANTGNFLYLLLPLIVLGGYKGAKRRSLLITFSTLLVLSITEIPVITQELRFYTYSLGIGSILAGFGAYRILQHLDKKFEVDKRILAVLLLIPVISLSLHADLSQSWEFNGDAEPVYEELEKSDKGRVLVETSNSSIFDSFVLQEKIPIETKHWAVNEVHLDSSTSANYILTLESWISEDPIYNPICRTCNSNTSSSLLDQRLDDLGIRYVVVRTSESRNLLRQTLDYRGKYGDYWLFENSEGYQIVEPLDHKPVALIGSYEKWKQVNDLLFTKNISTEIVLEKEGPQYSYSQTLSMNDLTAEQVVQRIEETDVEEVKEGNFYYNITDRSIEINSSVPVKAKVSYSSTMSDQIKPSKFNTLVLMSGRNIKIG